MNCSLRPSARGRGIGGIRLIGAKGRRLWVAAGLALACALGSGGPAVASTTNGCTNWPFGALSSSRWQRVAFKPGQDQILKSLNKSQPDIYNGMIVRPPIQAGAVGAVRRPAVLIMHGRGANMCELWWAARYLADHKYVAMVITVKSDDLDVNEAAARAGVKFLRSGKNPFKQITKRNRIGLAGHSLGAAAISFVQAQVTTVKAIVAFDNLRAAGTGDPGVTENCTPPASDLVTPSVPAMGIASETPCSSEGDGVSFTQKRFAFGVWKQAGRRTMEVVLNGVQHPDFGAPTNAADQTEARKQHLSVIGFYMKAWFDVFLKDLGPDIKGELLSTTPAGMDVRDVLSTKAPAAGTPDPSDAYQSSAYLPAPKVGGTFFCDDLRAALAGPGPNSCLTIP
jgi:hypothetical protein